MNQSTEDSKVSYLESGESRIRILAYIRGEPHFPDKAEREGNRRKKIRINTLSSHGLQKFFYANNAERELAYRCGE